MKSIVLAIFLSVASLAFSQSEILQPNPDSMYPVPQSQLVAWSQMQQPEPAQQDPQKPAPLPPDPKPETQPEQQQPEAQPPASAPAASDSQRQSQSEMTLTGMIVKVKDQFVLKSADDTYQLDNQAKAQPYEGKQVKVVGTVDASTKTVHVQSIDAIS